MNDIPPAPRALVDRLKAIVGPKGWAGDADIVALHLVDIRGIYRGETPVLLFPGSTAEVAAIVAECAKARLPIVPQGGNTGLAGAATPRAGRGEVLVNLKRMNKVRQLDALDYTMTVEAGCILAEVQKAAEAADRFFPLSLGAEGSCQIGGNLSTNAGGISVLRYGNARDLVLGLEAVLPDGQVWNGLRRLRKDNTGYALKQLFIGAEGTLGIVTAAVLRLFPRPRETATAYVALRDLEAAIELLAILRAGSGDAMSSFELIPRAGLELGMKHLPGVADPLQGKHAWYALAEFAGTVADGGSRRALEAALEKALEDGAIADAAVAQSQAQALKMWRVREAIAEIQSHAGASVKHDISVPVSKVPEFIARADAQVAAMVPGIRPIAFGHIGDGNVHYNLYQPEGAEAKAFLAHGRALSRAVHDIAAALDGSFSAEHGVGQSRREDLVRYRPAVELDMMRRVKAALDPLGIMNPGKVL